MCSIPPPPVPVEPPKSSKVLATWFEGLYPEASKVTRPGRFEATVRKIAAPALLQKASGKRTEAVSGKIVEAQKYHSQNFR